MNLLIITQKVDINDDVLGFMHAWIIEFAKHCERLTVICLQKGEYNLPSNVKVLSLGKENGSSKLKYLTNFYKYIRQERKNYDAILVHMNQIYVILGWILWRAWRKKIALWYAHGQVSLSLRIAEKLTDIIFTSTKSGCRLNSKKIKVIGQGIPKFQISDLRFQNNDSIFNIISIGRISPSKDYETLINAVKILQAENINIKAKIIGGAGLPEQDKYLEHLKMLVAEKNLERAIEFIGPAPNKDIAGYLEKADLFVSTGLTGSLDKAMAEAMACGLVLLTCNEAMLEVLGGYKDKLMYNKKDYKELARKVKMVINMPKAERQKIGNDLRAIIIKNHSLENFVKKIINNL